MPSIKDEWYIIVNPHAGSGKTMRQWVPAENKLKELGVPFYTVYTTHRQHATALAGLAAGEGYRKIMAVGGDGSLHEVFDGVLKWCEQTGTNPIEFLIAVAPIGSGNDWIKAFGVPRDVMKVVDIVAKETCVEEDVVRVTLSGGVVSYMANIGGIGFDSHVCERVNAQKERGKRSSRIYFNSLIYNALHSRTYAVDFYRDDELVYSGEVLDIAFGNGPYCGGGMRQCVLANPSDGIIDAVIVPKLKLSTVMREIPRVLNGTLDKSKNILYVRGHNFKVVPLDARSADIMEIDGEIVGKLPIEISLLQGRKIRALANLY